MRILKPVFNRFGNVWYCDIKGGYSLIFCYTGIVNSKEQYILFDRCFQIGSTVKNEYNKITLDIEFGALPSSELKCVQVTKALNPKLFKRFGIKKNILEFVFDVGKAMFVIDVENKKIS